MIKVKYIPCLFEDRSYDFDTYNLTLSSIFLSLIAKYPEIRFDEGGIQARVNGTIIPAWKWKEELKDGDRVLFVQEIGYGIELFIAAVLGYAGVSAGTAAGVGLFVGTALSVMGVVATIATIAYSIYSFCTAPAPPSGSRGLNSSPTYGWDGIQMQVRQGVPVPVVYGEHAVGGNLIEAYVTSDSDKSYLNLLIALSEGEIEGIMKEDLSGVCTSTSDKPYVLLNDNLISNFDSFTWDYRLGTQDQTMITGFGNICQTYSLAGLVIDSGGYTYTTVDTDVEGFELRFRVPVIYRQRKGEYHEWWVIASVKYKLHSLPDLPENWTSVDDFTVLKKSMEPVRRFARVDNLTPGQYDIRIIRTSEDPVPPNKIGTLCLDNVIEIKYDTLIYPHTALLAIKLLATEQLSGQLPNIITRIRGKKVKNLYTTVTEWTNNPIYCVNDLIVTPRYGLGRYIAQSNINNDQLISMANYCNEILGNGTKYTGNSATSTSFTDSDYTFVTGDIGKYICCKSPTDTTVYTWLKITSVSTHVAYGTGGWSSGTPSSYVWEFGENRCEMDLAVDVTMPALDCINQVCGSFRGSPMWNHDAIQIFIDKKEVPSYIFNMGNIIEGSFKHAFGSEKSKPNKLEVDYADRSSNFKKSTVDISDYVAITGGVPQRIRRLSLLGASRQSQVYREARYHLLSPKYQDEQISFKGAIDAIHMLPGDVTKFQHDVFQWGVGGRIVSATTNSVTMDQSVVIGAGTYYISVMLSDGVLETKTITSVPGTYTTVSISPATFTSIPLAFSLYVIGVTGSQTKPFRIMQIMKTPENEIQVSATEYSDSVYTDTDIIIAQPVYSGLPPNPYLPSQPDVTDPLAVPPDVTNFSVTEMTDYTGIRVTFTRPAETTNWAKLNVYMTTENWISIANGGVNYSVNDVLNLVQAGASGGQVKVLTIGGGGTITSIELVSAGSGYDPGVVTTTGGTGSGATMTLEDIEYQFLTTMYGAEPFVYRDVIPGYQYVLMGVSYSLYDVAGAAPVFGFVVLEGTEAPTTLSLTATAGFDMIVLKWTMPEDPFIYETEVWGGPINDRDDPTTVLIASVFSTFYMDMVGAAGVTKYYWIRLKAPNGSYGPWYPLDAHTGVYATSVGVGTDDLINESIIAAKLADSAIITSKLAPQSVDTNKLRDLAVNANKIANQGITGAKIANQAIGSAQIQDAAIGYAAIAAGAIGAAHIGIGTIQTAHIGDGQILDAKIGIGTIKRYHLVSGIIDSATIGFATITGYNLGVGIISDANIALATITDARIKDLTINGIKIVDFAVTRGGESRGGGGYIDRELTVCTVSLTTNSTSDSVLWWTRVNLKSPNPEFPTTVTMRIKRDGSTQASWTRLLSDYIIFDAQIGADSGGTVGPHTWTFTLMSSGSLDQCSDAVLLVLARTK